MVSRLSSLAGQHAALRQLKPFASRGVKRSQASMPTT